jgi:hypothetical protein
MYNGCFVEYNYNLEGWIVCFPDTSKVTGQVYKSKGWGTRELNRLQRANK